MTPLTAHRPHAQTLFMITWWITALGCWAGTIASLPGYYRWFIRDPILRQFTDLQMVLTTASGLASFLCALVSLSLATFLFIRKPGDTATLFVSFYLLLYGLIISGPLEMFEFSITGQAGKISYVLQSIFFTVPAITMMLVFPNGIITPSRFRWLIPLAGLSALLLGLSPGNEYNALTEPRRQLAYLFTGSLALLALGAQLYRYVWKSSTIERQQTKIVLYGFFLQSLLIGLSSIAWFQLPPVIQGIPSDTLSFSFVWWMALAIQPISFTIAIFRARLWDIDIVIRRTLVYGFLSVTLAVVYFGSVVLMQAAFRQVAGHESSIAVILSTLVIASLFTPLRSTIQSVIDRRFYRSKYNTEQALERFQQSLRGMADLEQVENELTGIVNTTVQPEWTEIWIRKPQSGS